ncbi:MAG: MFS transporter [Cyanobium sp.]
MATGISTAGSFAGLTARSWILLEDSGDPLLLALHFAALALPTLLFSGPAGVITDRLGSEAILVRSQWALLGASLLAPAALPLLGNSVPLRMGVLLLSTLLVGIASSFELTARNKICALLVDSPAELAPYLASFSVVFNVGKLVGPPLGGWLVAWSGAVTALSLDALSYLLPLLVVLTLLRPDRSLEQRSGGGREASLLAAWHQGGNGLRHTLRFSGVACLVGFFHPGLAPLIAGRILGPTPQSLGVFTAVMAAGSVLGGVLLQRFSPVLVGRPSTLLGGALLVTALAQLGMACSGATGLKLAMALLIGGGTALLLAGSNLVVQMEAPMVLKGRMAALQQIFCLGGAGLSGLVAALLMQRIGLDQTFLLLGLIGSALALRELLPSSSPQKRRQSS